MSQIRFMSHVPSGAPVQVVTGWDRPLRYIHLTVYDAQDEVFYSELDGPAPFSMGVDAALGRLDELGIPYPPTLRGLLQDHRDNNVGNSLITMPTILP